MTANKIPRLSAEIAMVLLISVCAGLMVTQELIEKGAAFWDNVFFYSIFWNQMDSLNRFGEFAWWFPANQAGWPAFFYSALGDVPCLTPVFMGFATVSWGLGRLGINPSWFGFFIAYYAFVVPALLNVAVYFVAKRFLVRNSSVFLAVVLSAFSPGLFVNVSDLGFIEPLIYSLIFFLAWISYLASPTRVNFFKFTFGTALIALTANFPFLIWNFYFLPVTVLITIFLVPGGRERFKSAIRAPSIADWAIFTASVLICAGPAMLVVSHSGQFIRSTIGTESYNWRALTAGNPLEYLAMSLPGVGFEWGDGAWRLKAAGREAWTAYQYLGLMALPFSILALLFGPRVWRMGVLVFFVVSSCIVALSAHSPFFATLIQMVGPLRTNSHWPDLGFRAGGYLLIILLTTKGFELLANGQRRASRTFPILCALNIALVSSVLWYFHGPEFLSLSISGFALVLSVIFLAVSVWLFAKIPDRRRVTPIMILLALCCLDVTTNLNLHSRMVMSKFGHKVIGRPEVSQPGSVGLSRLTPEGVGDFADRILVLKPLYSLIKEDSPVNSIGTLRLFNAVHSNSGPLESRIREEKAALSPGNSDRYFSLAVEPEDFNRPELQPFAKNTTPGQVPGQLKVEFISYNELILSVTSAQQAVLFLRDSFYPGWSATINGTKAPIFKALFNFKALVVPEGSSTVNLTFQPRGLTMSLWLSYVVLIGLLIVFGTEKLWNKTRRTVRKMRA